MSDDDDEHWARTIRSGSNDDGINRVVLAVNQLTSAKDANRADVIIACSFILAQNVTDSGNFIAAEMRQGISALIDGFVLALATGAAP